MLYSAKLSLLRLTRKMSEGHQGPVGWIGLNRQLT
jgi:hypothetical protein